LVLLLRFINFILTLFPARLYVWLDCGDDAVINLPTQAPQDLMDTVISAIKQDLGRPDDGAQSLALACIANMGGQSLAGPLADGVNQSKHVNACKRKRHNTALTKSTIMADTSHAPNSIYNCREGQIFVEVASAQNCLNLHKNRIFRSSLPPSLPPSFTLDSTQPTLTSPPFQVKRLLVAQDSHAAVKKKAALCLLRLYRTNPECVVHLEWCDRLASLMSTRHTGVLTSVMSLVLGLASRAPMDYGGLVPHAIRNLHALVVRANGHNVCVY
jgi:hypothetical protein